MLVITRKIGETVIVGDDVFVALLETGDGWAKLGITAPRTTKILREELVARDAAGREGAV